MLEAVIMSKPCQNESHDEQFFKDEAGGSVILTGRILGLRFGRLLDRKERILRDRINEGTRVFSRFCSILF